MARVVLLVCLLLFYFGTHEKNQTSGLPLLLPFEVLDFVLTAKENYEKVKGFIGPKKTELDEMTPAQTEMLNKLDGIASKIDLLRVDLLEKLSHIPDDLKTYTKTLFALIGKINYKYQGLKELAAHAKDFNIETINDFAEEAVTSSLSELPAIVDEMHRNFRSGDFAGNTILSILTTSEDPQLMCKRRQSRYQMIKDLYNIVTYTDIKAAIVQLCAYDYKEVAYNTSYKFEKKEVEEGLLNRTQNLYTEVKNALDIASRDIWSCDPDTHVKDVTYSKLDKLFEKVIIFERDIEKTCSKECPKYDIARKNSCKSDFCKYETKKRCYGYVRDCESLSSDMDVCFSRLESEREYEWISTSTGRKYGRHQDYCEGQKSNKQSEHPRPQDLNGFKKIIAAFIECSFCLCTCEDVLASPYHISLEKAESDVFQNKVVTGIRFRQEDYVFYIEIQEGKLEAKGIIKSAEWKIQKPWRDMTGRYRKSDLYPITWDTRRVFLDDLESTEFKNNSVITGVGFTKVNNHLQLEFKLTSFDYETGLFNDYWGWRTQKINDNNRTPVNLKDGDVPILSKNNAINSRSGQYIEFQSTSVQKDLGQSTIPYIDLQEVAANPPVPLSGVGVFHKAAPGSGGFLALKIRQAVL